MRLRPGVAIDLGTVNTLIYVSGRGIVLEEPSAIAIDRNTGKLAAVGEAADVLAGKDPEAIDVVHPLRDGVIADLDAATAMLQAFLRRIRLRRGVRRGSAVVCVPSGATWVERQALATAAYYNLLVAAVATVPTVVTGLLAWQLQLEGARLKGLLLQHLLLAAASTALIWMSWWMHYQARRGAERPLPAHRWPVELLAAGLVALTAHLGGFLSGVNLAR